MRAPAVKVSDSRQARYAELAREIDSVVAGETNLVARMASVTAILSDSFEKFFWTGFYLVDPAKGDQLVVGPYQGTLGCLRIDFGRGVCGVAAAERKTVIVADVDAFPGHIACDSRSKSEIVVPVFDRDGALIAVLDVDATEPDAFSETDAAGLEEIVRRAFAH